LPLDEHDRRVSMRSASTVVRANRTNLGASTGSTDSLRAIGGVAARRLASAITLTRLIVVISAITLARIVVITPATDNRAPELRAQLADFVTSTPRLAMAIGTIRCVAADPVLDLFDLGVGNERIQGGPGRGLDQTHQADNNCDECNA
jgi:hypothetical protein